MPFRRRDRRAGEAAAFPRDADGGPLRNTALVEAMRNVSLDDADPTRALLYQLLLDSTLVVASPTASAEPRSWVAGEGERLDIVTLEDDEGSVMPAFTSTDALLAWQPEGTGYFAMPATALFQMASNAGTNKIALDPGSPIRGFLTRHEIEALARGRLPLQAGDAVASPTPVRIGVPAVPPPQATIDAVTRALAGEPLAERAWLCLVDQGTVAPEMVIAIRFAPDAVGDGRQAAMRSVVDAAGWLAEGVRDLLFVAADDALVATLTGGAGRLIFER